ncbi:MAG TPA: sugar phosphate nucleotidyltransferase, partial [Candidatus Binataceae bacterium]|nr:sugar phosphate nucleotidyltransferase [Candidatus Binataceae bacterium]
MPNRQCEPICRVLNRPASLWSRPDQNIQLSTRGSITMKVVILAGGLGTRLREGTEYRPKPMVEIGGRPLIWHIMKIFAAHGHTDF